MMNENQKKIFDIIQKDVCGICPANQKPLCKAHRPRCFAAYSRQAEAIYKQIVQPLEKKSPSAN